MAGRQNVAKEICRFFNTPAGCRNGSWCRFKHERQEQICRFFRTPGGCRYGNACCFRHDMPSKEDTTELTKNRELTNTNSDDRMVFSETKTSQTTDMIKGDKILNTKTDKTNQNEPNNNDKTKQNENPEMDKQVSSPGMNQASVMLFNIDSDTEEGLVHTDSSEKDRNVPTDDEMIKDTKLTCGECGQLFDEITYKDSCEALEKHYFEKFSKLDSQHINVICTDRHFKCPLFCGNCERVFKKPRDLLQHIVAMAKKDMKEKGKTEFSIHDPDEDDSLITDHEFVIGEIVQELVVRDSGVVSHKSAIHSIALWLVMPGFDCDSDSANDENSDDNEDDYDEEDYEDEDDYGFDDDSDPDEYEQHMTDGLNNFMKLIFIEVMNSRLDKWFNEHGKGLQQTKQQGFRETKDQKKEKSNEANGRSHRAEDTKLAQAEGGGI